MAALSGLLLVAAVALWRPLRPWRRVLVRARANTVMALGLRVPHSILTAKKIPYAIAIGVGGLVTFPQSPLVLAALEQIR